MRNLAHIFFRHTDFIFSRVKKMYLNDKRNQVCLTLRKYEKVDLICSAT